MFFAFIFRFTKAATHLGKGHFNGLWLSINRTIRGQPIDLALLIADDGDLILKGHIFLNIAADHLLHSFQGVVDLDHLGVLVRLHKQDGNLSTTCFYRLLAERFVERNRLEPDTVHEVEAGIQGVALPDFDYIRHGKRASFVVSGMINIELLIDVFERDAVHFAVINSVVSGCVDFLSAFDFFEGFHSDEAHIGGIPVHIDLINAELSHRSLVLSLVLLRWIPSWKQRKSL